MSDPLEGRVLADRYRITGVIGRGGMATVHAAHDEVLDREVAIKVMLPSFGNDERFLERFRREARAAAGLNHPNIVAVHDTGDDADVPFIVMELVRGTNLDEELATIDRGRALDVCADVCAALAYAHDRGVVHRDVKPANILLAEDGTVKVTDFGIARAAGTDTITMTSVLGTAAYLSPEQARGDEVDGRSDLYSLGVVLYELLTGQPPFTGGSPVQVALRHVAESPPPPSEVADDVPAELEAVVLTLLAKEPEDRYADARAVREDLLAVREGRSVSVDAAAAVVAAGGLADGEDETVPIGDLDATALLGATAAGPAADEHPTSPRRPWLPWAAFGAVVLLALLSLVSVRGAEVEVPALKGLDRQAAVAAIEDAGLTVAKIHEQPHDSIPAEQVLASRPRAGELVREGTGVEIAVSMGPAADTTAADAGGDQGGDQGGDAGDDDRDDDEDDDESGDGAGDGGGSRGKGQGRGGGRGGD